MEPTPPGPSPVAPAPPPRLLRLKAVLDRVGVSKSSLYRMMQDGRFPRPLEITPGWKAWRECDVSKWIEQTAERAATVN